MHVFDRTRNEQELKLSGNDLITNNNEVEIVVLLNNFPQVFSTTRLDNSLVEAGNTSLYMPYTEMFHYSISPLPFDKMEWQKLQWSVRKDDYEFQKHLMSLSGFALELNRTSTPFLINTFLPQYNIRFTINCSVFIFIHKPFVQP